MITKNEIIKILNDWNFFGENIDTKIKRNTYFKKLL